MIIPDGCIGLPTLACLENNIPVIAVRGNKNAMNNDLWDLPFKRNKLFIVDNYLEAVGIMTSLKAGVAPSVVQRPIKHTKKTGSTPEKVEEIQEETPAEEILITEVSPSQA